MKTVSIIRERGQLTIPDSIRKAVSWDKLWKQIRRVRGFKGKGQGNLSAFIADDREARRCSIGD